MTISLHRARIAYSAGFFIFLMLTGCSTPDANRTQPLTISGSAPYDTNQSLGVARRMALSDAQRQAAAYQGSISGTESFSSGTATSVTQLHPQSMLGNPQIVGENSTGNLLNVTAQMNASSCGRPNQAYRKKLAVTSFQLLHRDHSSDVGGINYGYATLLAQKIARTGQFVIRDAERNSIFEFPAQAPRPNEYTDQENNVVVDLADDMDAQFVVGGIISDMQVHSSGIVDAISSLTEYLINIPQYERTFAVEMFLYDGHTGTLLDRQAYSAKATGKVFFQHGTDFDSQEFMNSAIGEEINKIIDQQTASISARLRCMPLSEHILEVDGQTVYINAGGQQNLHVNDELVVYGRDKNGARTLYYQNTQIRGRVEAPVAVVTIQQVQPLFSIGILDIKNTGQISPMDHVRSW